MKPEEAFAEAWKRTHAAEGGYSNNPKDPGGETNHGITYRVARANGYYGPMKDLPREIAEAIAEEEYWLRHNFHEVAKLNVPVALELFDTQYNMWEGSAAKFLQRALNALNKEGTLYYDVDVDGRIGIKTLDALEAYLNYRGKPGEVVLLRMLNAQQCCDYIRQANETVGKEEFVYGWVLNRVGL